MAHRPSPLRKSRDRLRPGTGRNPAVARYTASVDQIHISKGVIMTAVGVWPITQSQWPPATRSVDMAVVKKSAGHRNTTIDLLFDQGEIGGLHLDAITFQRLDLGAGLGGVAIGEHLFEICSAPVRP